MTQSVNAVAAQTSVSHPDADVYHLSLRDIKPVPLMQVMSAFDSVTTKKTLFSSQSSNIAGGLVVSVEWQVTNTNLIQLLLLNLR